MRSTAICLFASALLLATAAQGVTIPDPLPSITMETSPENPTSADTIVLALSGVWPDTCWPRSLSVSISGTTISADLLLPGADDCDEPTCDPIPSFYQATASLGQLSPGLYFVHARVVSCNAASEYEPVFTFQVGLPTGGPGDLTQGACVVLLAGDQPGLPGLQAGRNGTIVCSTSDSPLGPFLVSWDFYHLGTHNADGCSSGAPALSRPNSTTLVDPLYVPLGTCFDTCGVINPRNGCILLETDTGLTYNVVDAGGWLNIALSTSAIRFGDRVRVKGLLSTIGPRPNVPAGCPRENGDIHEPVVTICAPSGDGGEPCQNNKFTIDLAENEIRIYRDPQCSTDSHSFSGCAFMGLGADHNAKLSVQITPLPSVGGTWTATITPDTIAADSSIQVEICVEVEGLDLSAIPAGQDVKVADISVKADAL